MKDDYTLNYNRIREQYESRGLEDCLIKNSENIKEIHGVDLTETPGFNILDDYNKKLYEKFLVRFFNGWEIDTRDKIKPAGIHFVTDIEYYVTREDGNVSVGKTVTYIDNGTKKTLYNNPVKLDEEYQGSEVKQDIQHFLRFDYTFRDNKEWLHINGVNNFY